jgi:hypothetical protein
MKFFQILMAYNVLGNASLLNLDIEDINVIMDFRKKAFPYIKSFQDLQKDVAERLKPNITEDMSKEDIEALNEEFRIKVNQALNEDFNKDIDINLDNKKTSPRAESLILKNSNITINDLEAFRFLLG